MTQAKLTLNVRPVTPPVSIIDIIGEVTGAADKALTDAYDHAKTAKVIILNFSGLEYMNSSGIGLLVTLLIRAQRQGQKLMAFGLTEHYREIFELTRLNEAIRLFATEADALAAA
jgi:anti-sigma B factor antagonist